MALYNISTYSQYTKFLTGFMLCHTTSNLPPNCSKRVWFLACDGRKRGDPNVYNVSLLFKSLFLFPCLSVCNVYDFKYSLQSTRI